MATVAARTLDSLRLDMAIDRSKRLDEFCVLCCERVDRGSSLGCVSLGFLADSAEIVDRVLGDRHRDERNADQKGNRRAGQTEQAGGNMHSRQIVTEMQ